jgi:hypothetical protein
MTAYHRHADVSDGALVVRSCKSGCGRVSYWTCYSTYYVCAGVGRHRAGHGCEEAASGDFPMIEEYNESYDTVLLHSENLQPSK